MVGTPHYMAPEIVQGQQFDGRADQYALAVTVHELLSARTPFDAPFRAAVLMAQTTTELSLLSDIVPAVPRPVALAVRQGLSKDPGRRYPDCRAFAQAVLEALADAGAGRVRIPVPGWWFARPESEPDASWWEVGETPATVTLAPGEVYWLLARDSVTDFQLAGLARMGTLPSLRSLGLSFLRHLTDAGMVHLRGLTQLESLTLSQCDGVTDAGLAHLRGLERLESLSLDETQVTDEGLGLVRSFPRLRTLNLGQLKQLTDAGLAHVAVLSGLQKLFLPGCVSITDVGLEHLRGLVEMHTLDLGATAVTDAGLKWLGGMGRLEFLYLVGLVGVTDEGLGHLEGRTSLRKLFLGGCRSVSDRGMSRLLGLKHLEFLGLDGTAVSDAGLERLRALEGLQALDVRQCGSVTEAGVRAFQAARPGCRVSGP
jgi:hypothetical protein